MIQESSSDIQFHSILNLTNGNKDRRVNNTSIFFTCHEIRIVNSLINVYKKGTCQGCMQHDNKWVSYLRM